MKNAHLCIPLQETRRTHHERKLSASYVRDADKKIQNVIPINNWSDPTRQHCQLHAMNQNDLDNKTGKNHTGHRANQPVRILTASSITGDQVVNPAGEDLGKIFDIMLNLESGKIEYVIIAFGGFLGIGQKYFAVPFDALKIDIHRQVFIFNQTRAAFESHPGFNKHHWPEANFHSQSSGSYGGFMGPNTGADH